VTVILVKTPTIGAVPRAKVIDAGRLSMFEVIAPNTVGSRILNSIKEPVTVPEAALMNLPPYSPDCCLLDPIFIKLKLN
jgi:hypothetical protein